ncbi:mas-related G-protein coupled receptor member H-like [Melospiza georgiana]|uniref:mas-related G-protein coupled receptor member H-like n=1 Tax=Melospiza georgiana TaxID=44398 RepID=UPI0025AB6832|nr:mas-related G-protein coupled receptor member H-like [Melospiza georgiana]
MEVTTVSPSPASPTEGDDLCDTDVSSVAIHSAAVIIGLCGLAGNGAVIGLLTLKSRNAGIFDLAVIDFLFLLFAVPSALFILVEDLSCSPILPMMYMNFVFHLSLVSYYWALFRLTRSSPVRYMHNFCKFCCRCDLPLRLVWVVDTVQYWAIFAVFTVLPTATFLCPTQQQELCRAALIPVYTITLLLFAVPVVISHTVDFIKAKRGSQQQQPKRRDIVIVIIVLFTLLLSLCNFLQQLSYTVVPSQVVFLLTCVYSSIKPLIYLLAGRCRRPCSVESLQLSLQRVFEEPKDKKAHRKDSAMDTGV